MSSPPVPAALAPEWRAERVGESAGRPGGEQRHGGGEDGALPRLGECERELDGGAGDRADRSGADVVEKARTVSPAVRLATTRK
jgi:hypothetical protein